MNLINAVKPLQQAAILKLKRAVLRHQLLGFTETMLDDIGVSRVLLEQGTKAYPWRIVNDAMHTPYKHTAVAVDNDTHLVMQTSQYLQVYGVSAPAPANAAADVAKDYAKGFAQAA